MEKIFERLPFVPLNFRRARILPGHIPIGDRWEKILPPLDPSLMIEEIGL